MWKAIGIFVATCSGVTGQSIREYALDSMSVADLPVSHEVTAVTFPNAITAIAGADMLIDDGQKPAVEIEPDVQVRFQLTHAKGANFFLVKSLEPDAAGTVVVIFERAAYVIQLRAVAAEPVASAIFRYKIEVTARRVDRAPDAVRFSPRIGFSLLDRARAYPVLAASLPRAIEGVTQRMQGRTVQLPDLDITVEEVYRFSKEDSLVFLLRLRNRTENVLEIEPATFAVRVGNERFEQSIANAPRALQPGESADAEFAVVGMPDGSRNDLSADNGFTILVNTRRRTPAQADAPPTSEEAPP